MQILISCSKDMAQQHNEHTPQLTQAHFQTLATEIAREMNAFSAEELEKILKINPQLAALNKLRYHSFFDDTPQQAAILSYSGMVYRHLAPETWTKQDFTTAQQHLWTTSFLYGLLRPLDAIKTYRLEGKVQLHLPEATSLFRFWQQHLTDFFIASIQADDGVLLNLASGEMKSLFDWKRVKKACRIITPQFLVHTAADKYKNIVVYTKMMRGAVAKQVITQQVNKPEDLQSFTYEGFAFCPELSTTEDWVWSME